MRKNEKSQNEIPAEVMPAWRRLKEAINSNQRISINFATSFVSNTGETAGQRVQLKDTGGGGLRRVFIKKKIGMRPTYEIEEPAGAEIFIDYDYCQSGLQISGQTEEWVDDPWEIILWHESIGHGNEYIHESETRLWHHPGVGLDPIIQIENEARTAWNYHNPQQQLGKRSLDYYSTQERKKP